LSFTQWLLKNNKKLDHWTKEEYYVEWLLPYLQKESVDDALDRSLLEMQNYADAEPQTLPVFNNYFRNGAKNRIVNHIRGGRISPWVIYNCDSGIEFLDNLNEEQINLIMPYIDPDFWQKKFSSHKKDVDWLKPVLSEAGL
jgi:hypothetical protein